jgi:MFS transporter, SP family, general alpha glucoside:H+ symporter
VSNLERAIFMGLGLHDSGWALPAEIGSTRLRQKTVCLARNVSNITGVIGGTLENYFMNPEAWNLKGYTGFIWGGCAWLVFIWAYFRLPVSNSPFSLFHNEF